MTDFGEMSTDFVLSVMIGSVQGGFGGDDDKVICVSTQKSFSLIATDYMIRCHACEVNQSSASRIIRRQNLGLQVLRNWEIWIPFHYTTWAYMVSPPLCFSKVGMAGTFIGVGYLVLSDSSR